MKPVNYFEQYQSKLYSPEEAISLIQTDSVVFTGGEPNLLLGALLNERERFSGLKVYSMFGIQGSSGTLINDPSSDGHIDLGVSVLKVFEEQAWGRGRVDQYLVHFSEMEKLIEQHHRPSVLLVHCSPMQEDGWLYLGVHPGCSRAAIDCGAKVIAQVNDQMPAVCSDYYRVHISEVTAICEISAPIMRANMPIHTAAKEDLAVAGFVAERVNNGATLQIGGGILPDIVGLAFANHRDLGVHSETFSGTFVELIEKGAVNNSKKEICNGISVTGFFIGGALKAFDMLHMNPKVQLKKQAWINDPAVIRQISNIISINSCLGVDLRGQVCSESIGLRNTGGIGGQLDFVRGARRAPGGKSFIVMRSMVEKKDGAKLSKITFNLPYGSIVSTPCNDVMYVVTEYGVAELLYKSVRERAKALIAIAHPDFREELTYQAKKHGLI